MQVLSWMGQVGPGLFSLGLLGLSPHLTLQHHLLRVVGQELSPLLILLNHLLLVVGQELFSQVL